MAAFFRVLLLSASLAVTAQARIHWEAREVTLAGDPTGKYLSAVFRFRNDGPRTVRITDAQPDRTSKVNLPKSSFAPGEAGEFTVLYDLEWSYPTGSGNVWVRTDDPFTPHAMFTVKDPNHPVLRAEPESHTWREGEPATEKSTVVTTVLPLVSLDIESIDSLKFQARIVTETPGKTYRLLIRPITPIVAGGGSIQLVGTLPNGGKRRINVWTPLVFR
jgi:hypothetical protein